MLRVRFKREENAKFVSHLDLMECFDRAIRRAGLPMAYSQGYNPHPSMVFGLPLSVGVSSESEYMDIELTEHIEKEDFLAKLNVSLPEGIECIEAEYFEHRGNIMKEVGYASYDMLVAFCNDTSEEDIQIAIDRLKASETIIVQKEGKNGLKEVDIKPLIYDIAFGTARSGKRMNFSFSDYSGTLISDGKYVIKYLENVKKSGWKLSYDIEKVFIFSILCSAGSKANMKPELFASALGHTIDNDIKIIKVHRTGLFVDKNGVISSPI